MARRSEERPNIAATGTIFLSSLFTGLGMTITATPNLKLYESVLCCQKLEEQCRLGDFVDVASCKDQSKPELDVQADLAALTSTMSSVGAVGVLITALCLKFLKIRSSSQTVLLSRFLTFVILIAQQAIAWTNGNIPLQLMYGTSLLMAAVGITCSILFKSFIPELIPQSQLSFIMFLIFTFEAQFSSFLGDYLVGHYLDESSFEMCIYIGLGCHLAGILSLLRLRWLATPNVDAFPNADDPDERTFSRWVTILICLPAVVYNPITFTYSTIARQYLGVQFKLDMGKTSAVFADANLPILVLVTIVSGIFFIKTWYFHSPPLEAAGSPPSSPPPSSTCSVKKDVILSAIFLVIALLGNLCLGSATDVPAFKWGLILVSLGLSFTSIIESALAVIGGPERKIDLLLVNQLLEAFGRAVLVPVVSKLFQFGLKGRDGANGPKLVDQAIASDLLGFPIKLGPNLAFYAVALLCAAACGGLGVALLFIAKSRRIRLE
ncbi:hypothetical protein QBC43DRAFT_138268 [Cladorrhinum sp. PSN259]|nr:hypothetical protein QBC43DRAFT_138268 [Cladorrhinum sp. PSN259]